MLLTNDSYLDFSTEIFPWVGLAWLGSYDRLELIRHHRPDLYAQLAEYVSCGGGFYRCQLGYDYGSSQTSCSGGEIVTTGILHGGF